MTVTSIAHPTLFTLWKYPIDIMFMAKGIIPTANNGSPDTDIEYAASDEFMNSDVIGALNIDVAARKSTPQIMAVLSAILNAECTLGKYAAP